MHVLFDDYMALLENFPFYLQSRNNICSFYQELCSPPEKIVFRNTQKKALPQNAYRLFPMKALSMGLMRIEGDIATKYDIFRPKAYYTQYIPSIQMRSVCQESTRMISSPLVPQLNREESDLYRFNGIRLLVAPTSKWQQDCSTLEIPMNVIRLMGLLETLLSMTKGQVDPEGH